jgi:hypothetical protein
MPNPVAAVPFYDLLQMLKKDILKNLRVMVPGSIAAVNGDGTVNVNVLLMQKVPQQGLPAGLDVAYPQLTNRPVFTVQGGGIGAVMPVTVGDECMVVFADRAIDAWYANGAAVPLPSRRMHNITDGIVLVGINSQQSPLLTPLEANEGGICETKNAMGAAVVINSETHLASIRNGTENLATILGLLMTTLLALNAALASMTTGTIASGTTQTTIAALTATLTTVQTSLEALLY